GEPILGRAPDRDWVRGRGRLLWCERSGRSRCTADQQHEQTGHRQRSRHRNLQLDDTLFSSGGFVFERYTERARRTLFFARAEATQLGSLEVDSAHLLLGIVREGAGLAIRLLQRSMASPEEIAYEVRRRVSVGKSTVGPDVEMPFSSDCKL